MWIRIAKILLLSNLRPYSCVLSRSIRSQNSSLNSKNVPSKFLSSFFNQLNDKICIMKGCECFRQNLTRAKQMRKIRARECLAGVALAPFFQRSKIGLVFCIFNIEPAVLRIERACSRLPCRRNAVKQVAPFSTAPKRSRGHRCREDGEFFLRQNFVHPAEQHTHIFLIKRPAIPNPSKSIFPIPGTFFP